MFLPLLLFPEVQPFLRQQQSLPVTVFLLSAQQRSAARILRSAFLQAEIL
jgi:hypothetical protein